jgi:hypothetical protein
MSDLPNQSANANQPDDVEIDDTSLKYRVRVADSIYNSFIENKNIKGTIIVSPENITFKKVPLTSMLAGQETWNIPLPKAVLHGTQIENLGTVKATFSNIKFSADHVLNAHKYTGEPATTGALTADKFVTDNMLGLPCPYVEGALSGFSYNPLIAICNKIELKWGGNAYANVTTIDDQLLDMYTRFYDKQELKNFDRSMIPDEIADYGLFGKFATMPKYTDTTVPQQLLRPAGSCLHEIANHPQNPFSQHNRMVKAKSIKFEKASLSYNYTYNATMKVFKQTVETTTTLYPINVGGFIFPANCTEADYIASGISPFQAMFYYDKDNFKAFTIGANVVHHDTSPAVGAGQVLVTSLSCQEPAEQSLTQMVDWGELRCVLPCDELHMFRHSTFHNVGEITINKYYRQNPDEILKYCLPYDPPANSAVDAVGTAVVAKKYPCIKDIKVDISITASSVRFKQYTLPSQLKVATTSTLSFLQKIVKRHDLSVALGKPWKEVIGSQQFELNGENFNRVPYGMLVFGSTVSENSRKDKLTKGCKNVIIENITFKLDGTDPVMQSWDSHDLFKISKQNGLKSYDIDYLTTKSVQVPNVFTSTVAGNTYIPHDMRSVQQSQLTLKQFQNGNALLMRFGVDIPLANQLTASVGGLQSTLDVTLRARSDDPESKTFVLYTVQLFEREMTIDAQGMVAVKDSLFSRNDYVSALNLWQRKVQSGRLYINTSSLRGGSFFSSAVDKISSVLPKILPMIKKGISFYNDNKDAISQGFNAVQSGDVNSGRQALAQILGK